MAEIKESLFNGFKAGQTEFKESIAAVINSIALTMLYFIGVGLTSFFAKLSGKKFLDLKIRESEKSYWSDLNLGIKKKEDYLKQF